MCTCVCAHVCLCVSFPCTKPKEFIFSFTELPKYYHFLSVYFPVLKLLVSYTWKAGKSYLWQLLIWLAFTGIKWKIRCLKDDILKMDVLNPIRNYMKSDLFFLKISWNPCKWHFNLNTLVMLSIKLILTYIWYFRVLRKCSHLIWMYYTSWNTIVWIVCKLSCYQYKFCTEMAASLLSCWLAFPPSLTVSSENHFPFPKSSAGSRHFTNWGTALFLLFMTSPRF